MDIFILLIISILLYLLPENNDYLNVKSTSGLKGFLALGIVFHHLSKYVTTGVEFSNFSYMGTYIVSVFFFLSGYGLYVQNNQKENYLDNFLTKRLSRILKPFIVISAIYLIYYYLNGQELTISFFINLFKKGDTLILNGWFVNVIVLMYISFYLTFRIFRNQTMAIIVNLLLIVVYIIFAIRLEYGFWWYNSSLPFVLGLIWAKNKKCIDSVLSKYYFFILVIITGSLFISHQFGFIHWKLHLFDSYSYAFSANIDNLIFTLFSILIVRKIDFSNKYLLFLGRISFELYMIHGLVIIAFGKYFVTSKLNDVVFSTLVLMISIFLAWIIHTIINKISIMDQLRSLKFSKRRCHNKND